MHTEMTWFSLQDYAVIAVIVHQDALMAPTPGPAGSRDRWETPLGGGDMVMQWFELDAWDSAAAPARVYPPGTLQEYKAQVNLRLEG
jgi:hypothetical protein